MTTTEILRLLAETTPPSARWPAGWLLDEQDGPPDETTSPWFFAYADTSNDKLYLNSDAVGTWEEAETV